MGKFETTAIPILQALPAPPQYDYNELLLQAMKVLVNLKRFSPANDVPYTTVTKFKDKVKTSFAYIDKSVTNVNFSGASQLQKLKNVCDLLTPELSKAQQQLGTYNAKNRSQEFGISALSKFIESDATSVIGRAKAVIEPQLKKVHELWVRVYPDDIFVHTHEEALTEKEFDSGKRFWSAWWVASNDIEVEKAAWKRLCSTHGTKRASWIATTIDPRKSNIARNAQQLQQKPYAQFFALQDVAKKLAQALQTLKPAQAPLDFWNAASLNKLANVSQHLGNLLTGLQGITTVPDAMMQKMQVQLVRAQGDMQAMISKINALSEPQKTQFTDKLNAFSTLVTDSRLTSSSPFTRTAPARCGSEHPALG